MLLLAIDLETGAPFTLEDQQENWITELGAVLYCTDTKQPKEIYSSFVTSEISDDCSEYTGITQADLDKFGRPIDEVLEKYGSLVAKADYLVAHNGLQFDKIILDAEVERAGIENFPERTWIDTRIDLPFEKNIKSRSLTYLAGYFGIVNPYAHRAYSDCLTTLKVLDNYELDKVLASAQSPMVKLTWSTSYPRQKDLGVRYEARKKEFEEQKAEAKAAGFQWDAGAKVWTLETRQANIPDVSFKEQLEIPC